MRADVRSCINPDKEQWNQHRGRAPPHHHDHHDHHDHHQLSSSSSSSSVCLCLILSPQCDPQPPYRRDRSARLPQRSGTVWLLCVRSARTRHLSEETSRTRTRTRTGRKVTLSPSPADWQTNKVTTRSLYYLIAQILITMVLIHLKKKSVCVWVCGWLPHIWAAVDGITFFSRPISDLFPSQTPHWRCFNTVLIRTTLLNSRALCARCVWKRKRKWLVLRGGSACGGLL